VGIFRPWPLLSQRIENLPVQERDYKLFQKWPELEFGLKKFMLYKWAAKAGTLIFIPVLPTNMTLTGWL
jgi:hypothetical protein